MITQNFNGVQFDTRYTHLFCLGIAPTTAYYLIVPKEWLNNREDFMLVSMQKSTNATFKLTKPEAQLFSFDNFGHQIAQIIGDPEKARE